MGLLTTGAITGSALGNLLVRALQEVRRGNQPAVDAILSADTPGPLSSFIVAPSGTDTAWYIARLQAGVLLALFDGVSNVGNTTAFYMGYTPPFTGAPSNMVNSKSASMAAAVQALFVSKGWWGGTSSFLAAGHSAGGPAAQLLADAYKVAFPLDRVGWHTYGGPRTSFGPVSVTADRTPGVRWMNDNDPVPLLPVRFSDAPWAVPIVGLTGLLVADRFTHWAGGWQLSPGIVGHPEEVPVLAAISPVTSLITWLWNIDQTDGTGHTIGEYVASMAAEVALLTVPNTPLPNPAPAEVGGRSLRLEMNRAERQFAANIANAEGVQNAVPVAIPTTEVWRAVRLGRTWVVTLGSVMVAIGGSKKAARGLARLMNDAFRRLQRTAVVDPVALQGQLDAYLQVAADPAGNFRPVMNTTIPQ